MTNVTERLTIALAGRYRLERLLGQGGMATVYLAHDLKHDRQVALKVLKPELAAVLGAERFVVEIKTTAALSHPHILPLFDSGEADGFLYYVMPFVEGETLRARLNRETQLGVDDAVRLTREIAEALAYAHSRGVIHRDIKPENILLQGGRAMVADFGIALAVSAAAGDRMTETGLSLGTPHYMSPEQATAEKELTGRSDVYSLASVCYEMLAGEPPHMGNSAQQIIMKIITDRPRPVSELRGSVPPHVAAALAKALEKLPADRFETAEAFSEALANPSFTAASKWGMGVPHTLPPARPAAATIAAVGVAGLAVGAVVAVLLRAPTPPVETLRFETPAPAGMEFSRERDQDVPFALSPDGRHMAYVLRSATRATNQLYLRSLEQLEPTLISTAVHAASPFFSPDGRWIGYFVDSEHSLYKVPVSGGPAVRLASDVAQFSSSGHWSSDDWIYYTSTGGVLSRVRGTGGAPTVVTSANGVRWRGAPFALPGGRMVIVSTCAASSNCVAGDVEVVDIPTGDTRVLVRGAHRAWYLGDGILAYAVEDGAVFGVPFDAERGELAGEAVLILSGVSTLAPGVSRLHVTASGSMIYQRSMGGASEIDVVEVDRRGRPSARIRLEGPFRTPRYAPTGDRLVLSRDDGNVPTLWIFDVAAATLAPVAAGEAGTRPAWSPDGGTIAFLGIGSGEAAIKTVRADAGGAAEPLLNTESAGTPSYSRDGMWLIYDGALGLPETGEDVYAVRVDVPVSERTPQAVVSSAATEESGVVSPDGRWIAYTSNESGITQVFVRPFRREGGRWLVSAAAAGGPLWSSDREIVYEDFDRRAMVAARLEFSPNPRVIEREMLFETSSYFESSRSTPQYDVSRDGQRFVMLRLKEVGVLPDPLLVVNWRAEVKRLMAGRSR